MEVTCTEPSLSVSLPWLYSQIDPIRNFRQKIFISLAIGILGNKTFVLEVPQHSVIQQKPKFISSTFNKGQCEQVLVKL
jgi:hypothetical protein